MATWHKHSFFTKLDFVTAHGASWWFQLFFSFTCSETTSGHFDLFTMFFFYFDYRQLLYSLRWCLILFTISFSILFWYPTHHFKNIISRIETAVKILHKITRIDTIKSTLHSQKLMTWEQHLKCNKHWIDWSCKSFYMYINLLLLFFCWDISS